MTPADLQIPERGSAPVEDPAVVAGKEAQEAAAAWSAYAKAHPTLADEQTPEYKAIKERSEKADDAFSDAPVTSVAGALTKLRALGKDITEDSGPEGWQQGHVKTVAAFLEGVECASATVGDDPAVAAFAELKAAWTAFDALPDEVEEQIDAAAYKLVQVARDAVRDAVPVSLAGVAAKVRTLLEPYRADVDAVGLDDDYDRSAKAMLPFLEGAPVPAPKPDPVVVLFAEWGAINEEVIAHLAAIPEGAGKNMGQTGHVPGKPGVAPEEKDWDDALDRRDAVEQKILETPATSMRGVAVKIRLVTHCDQGTDLTPFYATPAREIDYEKECIVLECEAVAAISALLDAEQLAGVS